MIIFAPPCKYPLYNIRKIFQFLTCNADKSSEIISHDCFSEGLGVARRRSHSGGLQGRKRRETIVETESEKADLTGYGMETGLQNFLETELVTEAED